VIQTRGLTKRYRGTLAVDRLTFEVRPGTVTGFLGPNGAGKSTTMRMITALDRPDAGSALIGGRRYADLRWPLREVGAIVEAKSFQPGRSARAHLTALAASNQIPGRRVDDVLALTGLTPVAGKRAGKFSLGMAQRLGHATRCARMRIRARYSRPVCAFGHARGPRGGHARGREAGGEGTRGHARWVGGCELHPGDRD